MSSKNNNSVPVSVTLENHHKGHIRVDSRGISIQFISGNGFTTKRQNELTYYSDCKVIPTTEGTHEFLPLKNRIRIRLNPQTTLIRPYAPYIGQVVEDIYPPSSEGFYGRLKQGNHEASYIIQNVIDSPMKWLTIANPEKNIIYESHMIQPYEAEALALFDTAYIQRSLYHDISREKSDSNKQMMEMLDDPSPTWEELTKIVTDVSIPNLSLMSTTRDTLSQLVPTSFPPVIREQLMTFLSFVIKSKIPDVDPVEYKYSLLSMPLLGSLIRGHIRCMIDNTEWPPYVKLMTLAARGQLDSPKRAVSEETKESPWLVFWQKCTELFPNWLSSSIKSATNLNQSDKILLGLPVTKSAAKKSKRGWKERFASSIYDFRLLGHINTKSLGLSDLVYLGAAYRWPHRHMKFITRLGSIGTNTPHLQVMTMPLAAAERINRVLPGVMKIGWSGRGSNLNMFDDSSNTWIVPAKPIIDALGKTSSEKKLQHFTGKQKSIGPLSISRQEAKVLDFIASGINLEDLEIQELLDHLKFDIKSLRSILRKLMQQNLVEISYETSDDQLISLATIIQGRENLLISMVMSFLKNTPTSLVMVDDLRNQAIILSRLPETTAYELAANLPEQGFDKGLNIRCLRPTTFQSYTHNLYQRLLKEDGTWDDDVSAFLSQARSKREELSKSNA